MVAIGAPSGVCRLTSNSANRSRVAALSRVRLTLRSGNGATMRMRATDSGTYRQPSRFAASSRCSPKVAAMSATAGCIE